MTLNGVMALILRYFTNLVASGVHYVKVVEDRPTYTLCDRTVAQAVMGNRLNELN